MSRVTNVTDSKNSRYVQGGVTDRYPTRIGWWEARNMPHQDDDVRYVVDKSTEGRPDLISFKIYGKAAFYWVILQYNNIVDLEQELIVGCELRAPRFNRLMLSILNQKPGGNPVSE